VSRCASDKRHWTGRRAAEARLAWIQDHGEVRAVTPTGVRRCACGGYVLTSSFRAPNRKGKSQRGSHRQDRRR
jgi:hypothetical protein